MDKTLLAASATGLIALAGGVALGLALHRVMAPSPAQSASKLLEEHVELAMGLDNRPLPPQRQQQELAVELGERVLEATRTYPAADAVSRERIQRNVERVLHAGMLDLIPYADTRGAARTSAHCLQAHPRDDQALQACLQAPPPGEDTGEGGGGARRTAISG